MSTMYNNSIYLLLRLIPVPLKVYSTVNTTNTWLIYISIVAQGENNVVFTLSLYIKIQSVPTIQIKPIYKVLSFFPLLAGFETEKITRNSSLATLSLDKILTRNPQ